MHRIAWSTAAIAVWLTAGSGNASAQHLADTGSMISAAPKAVVGRVTKVESQFGTNQYGDQLILSRLSVAADEVLKGAVPNTLQVVVEGGTVGDLTLTVSDVATLHAGDRAVFLLSPSPGGGVDAFDHGRGILPLDQNDRVKGQPLDLNQIRRLCGAQSR